MATPTGHGTSDVLEAGVGMILTERHPFYVVSLRPGGAAAMDATIRVGDEVSLSLRLSLTRTRSLSLYMCVSILKS